MKIVAVGAGSYVFGPTVLLDAIDKHRLQDSELVLVDLDRDIADIMAAVGRRIAQDLGVRCQISATDNRQSALPGADWVILSASPQGARRWAMDYDLLLQAGMADQARECGGLGGLSNALRSISLALDIAADMERLCPEAALLDVTNPMPRLVTAISRFTSVRVYGFCNVAWQAPTGYGLLAQLAGREMDQIDVVTAGLNHFSWVVSARDKATGEDLVPIIQAAVQGKQGREWSILNKWWDGYGALCASGAFHAAEYLPYDPDVRYVSRPPYHGSAEDREKHWAVLRAIGAGETDWRGTIERGSWEHPIDVVAAIESKAAVHLDMINLPNEGFLADLPRGRVVEVPADIRDGALRGVEVGALPGHTGALCRRVSDVHELVAQGAATGDVPTLRQAIDIDPAIGDKEKAASILDEMLALHHDLLPRFA